MKCPLYCASAQISTIIRIAVLFGYCEFIKINNTLIKHVVLCENKLYTVPTDTMRFFF